MVSIIIVLFLFLITLLCACIMHELDKLVDTTKDIQVDLLTKKINREYEEFLNAKKSVDQNNTNA